VLVPRAALSAAPSSTPLRNVDDIAVSAVIQLPPVAPIAVSRPAQTVVMPAGGTVEALSSAYHADASAIRWANHLGPGSQPGAGTSILIPPGPGALVITMPAETPTAFATRLHLDPRVVLDYNSLTADSPLPAGTYLQVPLQVAPVGALISTLFASAQPGTPEVAPNHGSDTFPYGQCTWYVATRRDVTWGGNAITWLRNAAGSRPEGRVPVMGAIAVLRAGWDGHVAYVEHVNPDGSFVVSEMNFYANGGGWGRVDHRTFGPHDWSILVFIY